MKDEFLPKNTAPLYGPWVCSPALVDGGTQQGNKGGSPELITLSKYLALRGIKICAEGDARFSCDEGFVFFEI